MNTDRDLAVLVHGIWMPGFELTVLGMRMQALGYDTRIFRYPSIARPPAENAERLADFINRQGRPVIHCVGHSLGGIVILQALPQLNASVQGKSVLLASPVAGSQTARRLAKHALGRRLLGRSYTDFFAKDAVEWQIDRAVGLITGSRPWGLGVFLGGLDRPHDGTIMERETGIPGASARVSVNASHSGIIFSSRVARLCAAFLRNGNFDLSALP